MGGLERLAEEAAEEDNILGNEVSAIRNQNNVISNEAGSAADEADTARQNLIEANRAWVSVGNYNFTPVANGKWLFQADQYNVGRQAANDIRHAIRMVYATPEGVVEPNDTCRSARKQPPGVTLLSSDKTGVQIRQEIALLPVTNNHVIAI